jgi:hypothetical protein
MNQLIIVPSGVDSIKDLFKMDDRLRTLQPAELGNIEIDQMFQLIVESDLHQLFSDETKFIGNVTAKLMDRIPGHVVDVLFELFFGGEISEATDGSDRQNENRQIQTEDFEFNPLIVKGPGESFK